MVYVVAGMAFLVIIEGVLIVRYGIEVSYLRERLLKQIRANMVLRSIAESRVRAERVRRRRERTMPVEMTEVKHD